jgi:hypothetical protein
VPHKSSRIDTSGKFGNLQQVSQVAGLVVGAADGCGRGTGGRCGRGDSALKDNAEARRTQRPAEVPLSIVGKTGVGR